MMQLDYKMIIFDMAGTTVDENNVVYKTLQKTINEAGIICSLQKVLILGAGKEKKVALIDILSSLNFTLNNEEVEKLFKNFKSNLEAAYDNLDIFSQPNSLNIFKFFRSKNCKVVLNTGYDKNTALKLLNKLQWKVGEEIDEVITASDVKNARPNPDMIQLAMNKFNIENPKSVIKVGDSIIDIEEGKNANCGLTIGITTGAHTQQQLLSANPDFIINNLIELQQLTL